MFTCSDQTIHDTPPRKPLACVSPVLSELRRQLRNSPFAALKELQAEFYDGVVVLRGKVPTYYTRQVAIALTMKIDGVHQLDDRMFVNGSTDGQQQYPPFKERTNV